MIENQGGEAATIDADVGAAAEAALSSQEAGGSEGRDYEAEAREQGWRPKEEWTGKPDNWKDAKTYVEFGDTTKRISKMEERIEKEVSARVSKIEKVTATAIERLSKIHEKEIADLKAQRREAVKTGNVALVEKYDEAIENRQEQAPLTNDPKSEKAEVEKAFTEANPWYGKDKKMTHFAIGLSNELAVEHPELSLSDNIKMVLKEVEAEFPEYFKKPAANGHAAVDGGGESSAPPKKGKTASDLPSEARTIGMQLVKAGSFKDVEAYAKEYWKNA